jgi:hypothetical protein
MPLDHRNSLTDGTVSGYRLPQPYGVGYGSHWQD